MDKLCAIMVSKNTRMQSCRYNKELNYEKYAKMLLELSRVNRSFSLLFFKTCLKILAVSIYRSDNQKKKNVKGALRPFQS